MMRDDVSAAGRLPVVGPYALAWILGLAAIASIGFVISPFDATLRGEIGVRAFQRTLSAGSTGVAVGTATFVIDGLCALFVALGLWANPSWSHRLDRGMTRLLSPKKRARSPKEGSSEASSGSATSAASDLSLALGVGAGAVLLKYPTAPQRKWIAVGARYTVINSLVFGVIGWMVAGGANWMADAGFAWLRNGIIRWVPEPLVWTAIFVVTVLGPFLYGEWLDRRGLAASTETSPNAVSTP